MARGFRQTWPDCAHLSLYVGNPHQLPSGGERFRIGYLRGAAMGMSMRPFGDGKAFIQRMNRGARTVAVHWPRDFAPLRWDRMLLRRLRRGARAREAYER